MRRVLVTGSRDWVVRPTIWKALQHQQFTAQVAGEGLIIVHGAARGADDIADRWGWGMRQQGLNVAIEAHPADWDEHGKRAGIIRNQEMVNLGADVCLAFPLGKSHGTRHCMARAMAAGIEVINYGFPPFTQQAREFAEAYG